MTKFVNNKFDLNLLAASNNEDLVKAKKEWGHFGHEKSDQKKTCICNHKILKVEYFLNLKNGNIICCGSVCCKKFNFDTKKEIDNHLLKEILRLRKPYNDIDYKQFATIQEYLDYAKDELAQFMAKKIESAKFANLIIILENIVSIKTSFGVDTFDTHIELIKVKIVGFIPSYIEAEMSKDVSSIFATISKLGKLSTDYGVEKTSPEIFKTAISNIVDYYVSERGYSGDTTVPFQEKIDKILVKIEDIKKKYNKNMFLKDFFIKMNEKLKTKIQSIRDANFQRDKAAWEKQQKYLKWKHRNDPV